MTNLQKYTPQQVTEEKAKVLKAYEGLPVKDSNDTDLTGLIQLLIQETAVAVGHRNTFQDPKQSSLVIKDILQSIKIEHKGLRLDEIKLAFSLGRAGRFGDFANLNAKVFCDWIRDYKKIVREPAMKTRFEEPPKSQEEIDRLNAEAKERLKAEFLRIYKESILSGENQFTDLIQNKLFYDLLSDANIIPYKDPRKDEIFAQIEAQQVKYWKITGKSRAVLSDYLNKGIGTLKHKIISECKSRFFFVIVQECLDYLEDLEERLTK